MRAVHLHGCGYEPEPNHVLYDAHLSPIAPRVTENTRTLTSNERSIKPSFDLAFDVARIYHRGQKVSHAPHARGTDVGHEYPSTQHFQRFTARSARPGHRHRTHQGPHRTRHRSARFNRLHMRIVPFLTYDAPATAAIPEGPGNRPAGRRHHRCESCGNGRRWRTLAFDRHDQTRRLPVSGVQVAPQRGTRAGRRRRISGGPSHPERFVQRELEGGRSDAVGHRADQEGNRGTG